MKTLHIGDASIQLICKAKISLRTVEVFSARGNNYGSNQLFELLPNIRAFRGGLYKRVPVTAELPHLVELSNVSNIGPLVKYFRQIEILVSYTGNDVKPDHLMGMPKLKKLHIQRIDVTTVNKLDAKLIDLRINKLTRSEKTEVKLPITLEKLHIGEHNHYMFTDTKRQIYIDSNLPNIAHLTLHGQGISLKKSANAPPIPQLGMFLKVVDIPDIWDISAFTEPSTSICDVSFRNSNATDIDNLLSKLPKLTRVVFPRHYGSYNFKKHESPLDKCTELEIIEFMCNVTDNMEYLGLHLAKLRNLREIYFRKSIGDKVFKNMPIEIKKLILLKD
jgi:hypothetical protein